MKIELNINGMTLSENELRKVKEYYEAACTAEYMLENFDEIENEEQAMELGYGARRIMSKYNMAEDDAIEEVMEKFNR